MGNSISGRELLDSLNKARNMGIVEESFELLGQSLTVRNLRPSEVEAVLESVKGLADFAYLNMYQREHVARGLVEFNGFDFREIDFIDDEEPDPKKPGSMRKVRVERHKWVSDKIVATWGPETVLTAYKKVMDASVLADQQAKKGVTFLRADESPEETVRRLLGEIGEVQDELPATLLTKVLDDFGLIQKTTLEEMKAAEETLDKIRREEEAKQKAAEQAETVEEPEPGVAQATDIMASRKPLNREEAPPPERPIPPPPERASVPQMAPIQPKAVSSARAAELAALEGSADTVGAIDVSQHRPSKPTEVAELREETKLTVGQVEAGLNQILEKPPQGGINPKFRPPNR